MTKKNLIMLSIFCAMCAAGCNYNDVGGYYKFKELTCIDSNGTYKPELDECRCNFGSFQAICTDGRVCDAANKRCVVCNDGTSHCSNGKLIECENGEWSEYPCSSNKCIEETVDGKLVHKCAPPEIQKENWCDGDVLVLYQDNAEKKITCAEGCDEKAHRCKDCGEQWPKCESGVLYTCSNGHKIANSCKGAGCENNACKSLVTDDTAEVCDSSKEDYRCVVDKQGKHHEEYCDNNKWGFKGNCDSTCDANNKNCINECTVHCKDDRTEIQCIDGIATPKECSDEQVCNKNTGQCESHNTECPDNCKNNCDDNGKCKCPDSCKSGCDETGTCLPTEECTPGCDGNKAITCDGDYRIIQECQNGCEKEKGKCECPNECKGNCNPDGTCKTESEKCIPGSTQCLTDKLELCTQDGNWITQEPCQYGCNDLKTGCWDCNSKSQYSCQNGKLFQCKDKTWTPVPITTSANDSFDPSNNGYYCLTNGLKQCVNNNLKPQSETSVCINGFLMKCDHGKWEQGAACNQPDCNNGELRCVNKYIEKCDGGSWLTTKDNCTICDSNNESTAECQKCKEGVVNHFCSDNHLVQCIKHDGYSYISTECPDYGQCNSSGTDCESCVSNTYRCDLNTTPQICVNKAWTPCDDDNDCLNSNFYTCIDNLDTTPNTATLTKCSSDSKATSINVEINCLTLLQDTQFKYKCNGSLTNYTVIDSNGNGRTLHLNTCQKSNTKYCYLSKRPDDCDVDI